MFLATFAIEKISNFRKNRKSFWGACMQFSFRKIISAGFIALAALGSIQPAMAESWSYDPAKQGMHDLSQLMPIDGCNAPGGLQRISDIDEPTSTAFWCGTPPECLSIDTAPELACRYVPYCHREPRGDPKGIPGASGCRDPEDLRCKSGAMPVNGRCG